MESERREDSGHRLHLGTLNLDETVPPAALGRPWCREDARQDHTWVRVRAGSN